MKLYLKYFDYNKQQKAYYQNFKHFKSENYENDILIKNLSLLESHSYRLEIIENSLVSNSKVIQTHFEYLQKDISEFDSMKICAIILESFKTKNFKELSELKIRNIIENVNSYLRPKYEERFIKYHEINIRTLIQFYFYIKGNKILKFNLENKICHIIQWLRKNSEIFDLNNIDILELLTFRENRYITENLIKRKDNLFMISENKFTDFIIEFENFTNYEFFKFSNKIFCVKNTREILKIKNYEIYVLFWSY